MPTVAAGSGISVSPHTAFRVRASYSKFSDLTDPFTPGERDGLLVYFNANFPPILLGQTRTGAGPALGTANPDLTIGASGVDLGSVFTVSGNYFDTPQIMTADGNSVLLTVSLAFASNTAPIAMGATAALSAVSVSNVLYYSVFLRQSAIIYTVTNVGGSIYSHTISIALLYVTDTFTITGGTDPGGGTTPPPVPPPGITNPPGGTVPNPNDPTLPPYTDPTGTIITSPPYGDPTDTIVTPSPTYTINCLPETSWTSRC